jgi:Secretion system C-terminal sorting domain
MGKSTFVYLIAAITTSLFAQVPDTVTVPNDGIMGTINNAIEGDTTSSGEPAHPGRVFRLVRGGYYMLNGPVTIMAGTHVTIVGDTAPLSTPDPGPAVIIEGAVSGETYPCNFDCSGDLKMKHLRLMYVTNLGMQYWTSMQFGGDSLRAEFDDVIFEWSMAPCILVAGKHFTGRFDNCIFRNDIDPSQWWVGRQIAFYVTASCDSIICENNTFENMGMAFDADYAPPRCVWYNHNTFLNIAKYPFKQTYFTFLVCVNNIFVNCHFAGESIAYRVDPGDLLWGSTINTDTIPPGIEYNGVAEEDRVCLFMNNSNFQDAAFKRLYDSLNAPVSNPNLIIQPEPIMNARTMDMFSWHRLFKITDVFDSTDPHFISPATEMDSILAFLWQRYSSAGDVFWGYKPGDPAVPEWPLPENLTYTNHALLVGGMGGYPLGDLYHWFPNLYPSWCSDRDIAHILPLTGPDEVKETMPIPKEFALNQNYPNPFNPTTTITYRISMGGHVMLELYDVLGRKVVTLVDARQTLGDHSVMLDGSELASGVYFYQLRSAAGVITKKMILLK